MSISKGEDKIEKYLKTNKIIYESQKTFDDCKLERVLPFDFYLTELKILIEYQGVQHYKAVDFFGGEEALKKQRARDKIKRQYAKKKKIKLVIISYKKHYKTNYILKKSIKSIERKIKS